MNGNINTTGPAEGPYDSQIDQSTNEMAPMSSILQQPNQLTIPQQSSFQANQIPRNIDMNTASSGAQISAQKSSPNKPDINQQHSYSIGQMHNSSIDMSSDTSVLEDQQSFRQPLIQSFPSPNIQPLLESELKNDIAVDIAPQMNPDQQQTAQKSIITKVKLSDELNIFDWFRTADIITQLAEKAKNSVDSVITTLDPGMKEYLFSGGNVNIVVISDSQKLVSPIRDSFQNVFGRATVSAACYQPPNSIIDYPIRMANGMQAAILVAQEKIRKLRRDTNNLPQNQVVVVVQPAIVSIDEDGTSANDNTDDKSLSKWFLTYCMLIEDPVLSLTLSCYSQFVPLDQDIIEAAKQSRYPDSFKDQHLGFSMSIDELMVTKMQLDLGEMSDEEYGCAWLPKWAGINETQTIHQLSLSLANAYRRKWKDYSRIETVP